MKLNTKSEIEKAIGGLFFMILNTIIWTLIAEYYLENRDNRIVGILLGIIIIGFLFFYMRFTKFNKTLPEVAADKSEEEKKKDKRFLWVFALEGIGIFLAKNILVNINHNELFIPFFALIVGLHFFPLGKLFQRKFDYYMGIWTSVVALIGLYIIIQKITTVNLANAIVSVCCAVSTISYGVKMIISGQKAIENNVK